MIPFVIGAASITIGATILSWMYDTKTEEELKRQDDLEDEIDSLRSKFDIKVETHETNIDEIIYKNFIIIREKFLDEIDFYKNEKKDIKKDLNKLQKAIVEELKNESITPYQKQSLLKDRNRVEDAKNRLDAYWNYLEWFKLQLDNLEKYKNYKAIFNVELPQPLLPEEYLYIGKLAYIEKKELSFNNNKKTDWNKYDQKLLLNN